MLKMGWGQKLRVFMGGYAMGVIETSKGLGGGQLWAERRRGRHHGTMRSANECRTLRHEMSKTR